MPSPPKILVQRSLPSKYDAIQEVDDIGGALHDPVVLDHPYVYLCTDASSDNYAMAVASEHGLGAFYRFNGVSQAGSPAKVAYEKIASLKAAGCMLHGIPDLKPTVAEVVVVVTAGGGTLKQVVKTVHADDISAPPILRYGGPLPLCLVAVVGGRATVHCMIYLEGSGLVVDLAAAAKAKFIKHMGPDGKFLDWRLMVPLKAGTSHVLERVSFPVDNATGEIKPGDVLRVGLPNGPGEDGRSFGFQWA